MIYKHYNKSELFVEPSNKNCKFRRYLTDNNQRLIQYIEGTLTEIKPEDFDNETDIWSGALMGNTIYAGSNDSTNNIIKIEFSNSITTIGNWSNTQILNINLPGEEKLHVIFPQNLKTIKGLVGQLTSNIWDFSKLTTIPTWSYTNPADTDVRSNCFSGEIRIPTALYNSWTTATNWSEVASKMIAV